MNLKSLFNIKANKANDRISKEDELEYDKNVDFYYSNLINSIILFALTKNELEKLEKHAFDPMFELESEIDYAFTPLLLETVFRNHLINESLRFELMAFKKATDDIPSEIWHWDYLDKRDVWINVRKKANELLDKLGVKNRTYNEDFIIVYDKNGNILEKGQRAGRT